MSKVHVVWVNGGLYEPSYISAMFATPELAEAYTTLHNGGNEDHYYTGEFELDDPADLALIERGTRPWGCTYFWESGDEWDPESKVMITPLDPDESEREPTVFRYVDHRDKQHETWETTVIAPTAAEAREKAGKWIDLWNDLQLGEVSVES